MKSSLISNEEGIVQFLVNENGFNIDRAVEKIKSAKNKSSQGRFAPLEQISGDVKVETPESNTNGATNKKAKGGVGGRKKK
ncbi:hypothetical protein F2Q68_00012244 [Brassica cretica]|uniref:Uncharacterized protein n=1 Tax=Brassica cretica TaxID=69181 RepID=A0A8S9KXF5_BRACR|nr:hypothetical protein F2Q68_00012244 [Brassica cretica]